MEKQMLNVPNITCGHCVNSIKTELEEIDGVSAVAGDPDARTVTVKFDAPATLEKIRETLAEINYPAA